MAQAKSSVDLQPFIHQVIVLYVNGIFQCIGMCNAAFIIGSVRAFTHDRAGREMMKGAEHPGPYVMRSVRDKIKIVFDRPVLNTGSLPQLIKVPIVLITVSHPEVV